MEKSFFSVLITLLHWGNTQLTCDDIAAVPVHRQAGVPVAPALMDHISQEKLTLDKLMLVAGPKAGERIKRRLKNRQDTPSLAGAPNARNSK